MGFIEEGFGTVLGLFSTLLRNFCVFFGRSISSFCKAWAPDGLQEAFWMDFRSIWVGFGKGFGGFRENFGAFFRNFFRIFSNFLGTCFALRFNLARKGLAYFVQVFLCQGLTLCVFPRKKTIFLLNPLCTSTKVCLCRNPRVVSRSSAERLNARGSCPLRVLDDEFIIPTSVLLWEGFAPS